MCQSPWDEQCKAQPSSPHLTDPAIQPNNPGKTPSSKPTALFQHGALCKTIPVTSEQVISVIAEQKRPVIRQKPQNSQRNLCLPSCTSVREHFLYFPSLGPLHQSTTCIFCRSTRIEKVAPLGGWALC
jgi:hypothetical protein